jgi:hypothetical protein
MPFVKVQRRNGRWYIAMARTITLDEMDAVSVFLRGVGEAKFTISPPKRKRAA